MVNVSLLVPLRDDGEHRGRVWEWLSRYWKSNLPGVEIVVGEDDGFPFSKASAVNDAASRAQGDVFVILDADAYFSARQIIGCAEAIRASESAGRPLWFMPYRHVHKVSKVTTLELLQTNPERPYRIPSIASYDEVMEDCYRHGGMAQIMSRTAFLTAGGMDPRFRGWGGEDGALQTALNTLYTPYRFVALDAMHLWHEAPGTDHKTRVWVGQTKGGANLDLYARYAAAHMQPDLMWSIIDERQERQ